MAVMGKASDAPDAIASHSVRTACGRDATEMRSRYGRDLPEIGACCLGTVTSGLMLGGMHTPESASVSSVVDVRTYLTRD